MNEFFMHISNFIEVISGWPAIQLLFLALFASTWLIGGNILVAYHYKRLGKHWATGFKPFAFPFKDFNAKEWFYLLVLAVISLSFGVLALAFGNGT